MSKRALQNIWKISHCLFWSSSDKISQCNPVTSALNVWHCSLTWRKLIVVKCIFYEWVELNNTRKITNSRYWSYSAIYLKRIPASSIRLNSKIRLHPHEEHHQVLLTHVGSYTCFLVPLIPRGSLQDWDVHTQGLTSLLKPSVQGIGA